MAEFVLKNWHGEEVVFDHDKIFVKNVNGDLVQFTEGKGEAVLESLEVTENGTFTPPEGVDGFNQVTVNVEEELSENLMYYEEMNFASNSNYGGLYTAECPEGILNYGFEIELGQEYIITWDMQYYCVFAQDGSSFIPGSLFLGNVTAAGLSGNGEPFAIVWTPESLTFVSYDTESIHGVAVMKRVRPNSTNMMLQNINITENGEYLAEARYDGFRKVSVNVEATSADVRYVTFDNHDGTMEYGKKPVAVGDDCADPITRGVFGTPTRESTPQYDFDHDGWSDEPNGSADANWNKAIMEDKTVYASFKNVLRYYTITYLDSDGVSVLETESLPYGSMPSYTPEKEGYALIEWQPAFATVVGDASYTSVWRVDNIIGEGTLDGGLKWTLYKSGDLYIDGEGDMPVISEGQMPWYSIRDSITNVVVSDGITSLSSNAFCRCTNLKTCTLSANMTELPMSLFMQTSIENIVIPAKVAKIARNVFHTCNKLQAVTFEASASVWQVSTYGYNQGGTTIYVSNPTTNATYLKSTHVGKYWTKTS